MGLVLSFLFFPVGLSVWEENRDQNLENRSMIQVETKMSHRIWPIARSVSSDSDLTSKA